MSSFFSIFKIILYGRSSINILIATILSFSFSIAVILSTFGLMDGFDYLLKAGLHRSSGDLILKHRLGFFSWDKKFEKKLYSKGIEVASPVLQTEAFLVYEDQSQGVFCRGIDPSSFQKTTQLSIVMAKDEVVIGEQLANHLQLKQGDQITLAFGSGNNTLTSLPLLKSFRVSQIISHGIYQKDLRFVYVHLDELREILNIQGKINRAVLKVSMTHEDLNPRQSMSQEFESPSDEIEKVRDKFDDVLEDGFILRPYWQEFDYLFEAVKIEKFSITLILQLIVIVAVFNIISFVIFVMEKKAQDFFLLRALGLSLKKISFFWLSFVLFVWCLSCVGGYLLTLLFNWALAHVSFLQIPGDIYVLSSLKLKLDFRDYVIVFSLALVWIFLAAFIGHVRFRGRGIIHGIRQELN